MLVNWAHFKGNIEIDFLLGKSAEHNREFLIRAKGRTFDNFPNCLFNRDFRDNLVRRILKSGVYLTLLYPSGLLLVPFFIRYVNKKNPDVIIVNSGGFPGPSSVRWMLVASRFFSKKKVFLVANNQKSEFSRAREFFEYLLTRAAIGPGVAIVTSSYATSLTYSQGLFSRCRRYVVRNGICHERFETSLPRSLEVDPFGSWCKVRILVVANFEPRKGYANLIAMIRRWQVNFRDRRVRFLLEGFGAQKDLIREWVLSDGLEDLVVFNCRDVGLADLYKSSDLLVLPSVGGEDFPNVTLEAFMFGLPVIAFGLGGVQEQITEPYLGEVCLPVGDPDSLYNGISKWVEKVSRGTVSREDVVEFFKANFSHTSYCNNFFKVINSGE